MRTAIVIYMYKILIECLTLIFEVNMSKKRLEKRDNDNDDDDDG